MRNWAGNHVYEAARVREPGSVAELEAMVREGGRVRALGTRHAFNDLVDTPGDLLSLRRLPRRFELDAERRQLTIDGGATYGDIGGALDDAGWALHNLASLPHISVAGACATATHGSGVRNRSLASAAVGVELVRSDGEIERVADGDDRLPGAVVGLGALGIVTALTLAVEPAFRMRQDVYEGLPFSTAIDRLDEILSSADAVSLFTDWSEPAFHQVWVKRRVQAGDEDRDAVDLRPAALAETTPATTERHPIRGMSAVSCTPQLGVVGPWHERLPHFRLDHQPSAGDELQSEFIVRREDGPAALQALIALHRDLAPLTLATEIRSIAADEQWLSPAFGRDSIAFHFTWRPDWPTVRDVLPAIEQRLQPFELRPHWGKLFTVRPERVRDAYPKRAAFVELARSLDPERRFSNAFLDTYVFGEG